MDIGGNISGKSCSIFLCANYCDFSKMFKTVQTHPFQSNFAVAERFGRPEFSDEMKEFFFF